MSGVVCLMCEAVIAVLCCCNITWPAVACCISVFEMVYWLENCDDMYKNLVFVTIYFLCDVMYVV